jgi:phosphate/sulfate permease
MINAHRHLEQPRTTGLPVHGVRKALTALWVLLLGLVAYAAGTTLLGWVVMATLAVAPMALARLWTSPVPTMSERIQEAVR